jgi:hypothetical protein
MADLGPLPEVPSDGTYPPLESDPVLVAQGFSLVEARSNESFLRTASAIDYLLNGADRVLFTDIPQNVLAAAPWLCDNNPFHSLGRRASIGYGLVLGTSPNTTQIDEERLRRIAFQYGELRRISYTTHWRREDPTTELAPGSSSDHQLSVESGLTDSASSELSASLGAKIPIGWAEIGAKLTGCLKRQITITEEIKWSTTIHLDNKNPSCQRSRRFAIWYPVKTVLVEALEFDATKVFTRQLFEWKLISRTNFAPKTTAANTTSGWC